MITYANDSYLEIQIFLKREGFLHHEIEGFKIYQRNNTRIEFVFEDIIASEVRYAKRLGGRGGIWELIRRFVKPSPSDFYKIYNFVFDGGESLLGEFETFYDNFD